MLRRAFSKAITTNGGAACTSQRVPLVAARACIHYLSPQIPMSSSTTPVVSSSLLRGGSSRSFSNSQDSHDDFKPHRKAPPSDLDEAVKMIEDQVKKHKIMLYMKGTPSQPQCGFSAQTVRVLHASGVDFDSVNVLDYPMIREGVKQYSQWPTVPQLYVDGEFVGGCDIVTSLFQSGELAKLLEESAKKGEAATPAAK